MNEKTFLRLESLGIFLLLVILYHNFELSLQNFFIFILLPDVSMVGYFFNKKIGALVYNIFHNYLISIVLIIAAMATNSFFLANLSAIWAMHIAIDRIFGFGLKSYKGFKYTHLKKL